MNRKKIRALEDHVLPNKPEPAFIYITEETERTLAEKADKIKRKYRSDIEAFLNNPEISFEEKEARSEEIYNRISPEEKLIVSKDNWLMTQRIVDILCRFFNGYYPNERILKDRLFWIMQELEHSGTVETITEYDFLHRDEDAPDFDDFKWWGKHDRKIRKIYPRGVFTKKSWEAYKGRLDELRSEAILHYWKKHPTEKKEYMKKLYQRIKELRAK